MSGSDLAMVLTDVARYKVSGTDLARVVPGWCVFERAVSSLCKVGSRTLLRARYAVSGIDLRMLCMVLMRGTERAHATTRSKGTVWTSEVGSAMCYAMPSTDMLSAYVCAMRFPVLTQRSVLSGYPCAIPCQFQCQVPRIRSYHALRRTTLVYAATVHYAVSGTDVACAFTRFQRNAQQLQAAQQPLR
eukprot:1113823-Rhodomonas_salina.1